MSGVLPGAGEDHEPVPEGLAVAGGPGVVPGRCPTCGAELRRLTRAETVLQRHAWVGVQTRQLELDRGQWGHCDACMAVVMVSPRR